MEWLLRAVLYPTNLLKRETLYWCTKILRFYQNKVVGLLVMKVEKPQRAFVPKFTIEGLGENPFIKGLVIPVTTMPVKGQFRKEGDLLLPAYIDIEAEKMCKIYVTADKRKKVSGLSASAKSLLLWLYYEVEAGDDFLWLNRLRYMKENNVSSENTYRTAVKGLIEAGFISRTNVNAVYWINPALFFSGSRAHKFPKNVKKK